MPNRLAAVYLAEASRILQIVVVKFVSHSSRGVVLFINVNGSLSTTVKALSLENQMYVTVANPHSLLYGDTCTPPMYTNRPSRITVSSTSF